MQLKQNRTPKVLSISAPSPTKIQAEPKAYFISSGRYWSTLYFAKPLLLGLHMNIWAIEKVVANIKQHIWALKYSNII